MTETKQQKKTKQKPAPEGQSVPDGKVKTSFLLLETTQLHLNKYAAIGLKPGALIDLVFSDEARIHEIVTQHMANMPSVLEPTPA